MNESLSAEPQALWEHIAPDLDAALGELSEPDRDAVLLRYFEKKSAQEMAERLGISDDAAQKRVSRAVERLREFFSKRGVTVSAGGLVVVISANAVQAAPVGLAITISISAALAGTTVAATATATTAKAIAMTTLQKTIVTATVAVLAGAGIYEARRASQLRDQVQTLQQQQGLLKEKFDQLQREHDKLLQQAEALRNDSERLSRDSAELLRLRGEIARLRSDSDESARLKADGAGNLTESAAKSWAGRVNELKRRLEQTPEAKIPELEFVTEEDWLNAARGELRTETDYRRALSALRGAAEGKIAKMIQQALKKYTRGNDGQIPTDIGQLQPYFDPPVDVTVLQRWEVASAATLKNLGMGEDVMITQKAPVDEVFDMRLGIGPNASGSTDFLSREIGATMNPVWEAFRAAHNGQWPDDVSELQPYATTPEQQMALQKLMLRKSTQK